MALTDYAGASPILQSIFVGDEARCREVLSYLQDGYSDGQIARKLKVQAKVVARAREVFCSEGWA